MVTLGPLHVAEFKELLLALKLEIPDAKALRFFRICDKDNSGEIDFQEFQTVLYATDPGEAVVAEGGGWDSSSCESQLRHAAWMVVPGCQRAATPPATSPAPSWAPGTCSTCSTRTGRARWTRTSSTTHSTTSASRHDRRTTLPTTTTATTATTAAQAQGIDQRSAGGPHRAGWAVGAQVSDQKLEKLFNQFDEDESGFIDYTEFKQCWLL